MSPNGKRLASAIERVARRDQPVAVILQEDVRELRQQAAGYRDRLRAMESDRGAPCHGRLLQTAHLHHNLLVALEAELRATERDTGFQLPKVARDLERSIALFSALYGPADYRGQDNHLPIPTTPTTAKGGTP